MSRALDRATRLYGLVGQIRENVRREAKFADWMADQPVRSQERTLKMATLEQQKRELEHRRETWPERKELELQGLRNEASEQEFRRSTIHRQQIETRRELAQLYENDPEALALLREQGARERSAHFQSPTEVVAYLASEREGIPQDSQQYLDGVMNEENGMPPFLRHHGVSKSGVQFWRQNVADIINARMNRDDEVAATRISPRIMAQRITGVSVPQEEVADITSEHQRVVKNILSDSERRFDDMANEDSPLLVKQAMSFKAAVDEHLSEDMPAAERFAIAQAAATGFQEYINSEQQEAIVRIESLVKDSEAQAAFDTADRFVEIAGQSPEKILDDLSATDGLAAMEFIMNTANSGMAFGEVRQQLERTMGGDILELVKHGHLTEGNPEFRTIIQNALLDVAVQRAVGQGSEAPVAAVADKLRSQIRQGKSTGDGAMWKAMDAVVDRLGRAAPEIRERQHNASAAAMRESAFNLARRGMVTMGRGRADASVLIPEAEGMGERLADRIEDGAYTFTPRTQSGKSHRAFSSVPFAMDTLFGAEESWWRKIVESDAEFRNQADSMAKLLKHEWAGRRGTTIHSTLPGRAGRLVEGRRARQEFSKAQGPEAERARRLVRVFESFAADGYDNVDPETGELSRSLSGHLKGLDSDQKHAVALAINQMRSHAEAVALEIYQDSGSVNRRGVGWAHSLIDLFEALDADYSAFDQMPGTLQYVPPEGG